MTKDGRRIIEGLEDALKVASCKHPGLLPFHRVLGSTRWHCPACGAEFNRHPGRAG